MKSIQAAIVLGLFCVFICPSSFALPAGAYTITGLSVDHVPARNADGSYWDALDRTPDLMVVFHIGTDSLFATSSTSSASGASWSTSRTIELGESSVIILRLYDKDVAYNDFMDRMDLVASEIQLGDNFFESDRGVIFGVSISAAGFQEGLEPFDSTIDYSGNFGGTGQRWLCRAHLEGDYITSPNTTVRISLLAGDEEQAWWSGLVSRDFLSSASRNVEFGLEDPVYVVPLNDSLLAFYECPSNFDNFIGAGIGVRPCQVILAYDPVLMALVPVLTPQKVQQRLQAEQNDRNRALMQLAGPFIIQYLTGLDPAMCSGIMAALGGSGQ